jgi:hypothetical protein
VAVECVSEDSARKLQVLLTRCSGRGGMASEVGIKQARTVSASVTDEMAHWRRRRAPMTMIRCRNRPVVVNPVEPGHVQGLRAVNSQEEFEAHGCRELGHVMRPAGTRV